MLEQLRALPLSRKADPVDDPQRAGAQTLPVYGRGDNVRDWLFVEDHVDALLCVIERGRVGESYNVGGVDERRNIDVVNMICDLVDEMLPDAGKEPRRS